MVFIYFLHVRISVTRRNQPVFTGPIVDIGKKIIIIMIIIIIIPTPGMARKGTKFPIPRRGDLVVMVILGVVVAKESTDKRL